MSQVASLSKIIVAILGKKPFWFCFSFTVHLLEQEQKINKVGGGFWLSLQFLLGQNAKKQPEKLFEQQRLPR